MSTEGKRRLWIAADKLRIVLAGMQPGVEVSDLCRREVLSWSGSRLWCARPSRVRQLKYLLILAVDCRPVASSVKWFASHTAVACQQLFSPARFAPISRGSMSPNLMGRSPLQNARPGLDELYRNWPCDFPPLFSPLEVIVPALRAECLPPLCWSRQPSRLPYRHSGPLDRPAFGPEGKPRPPPPDSVPGCR
jgi:hypothetical protein